ncbi:hypothetical protein DAT35_12305 [Vitiosangium sp. GDMCC 1.1324]|nr:hypothetical protein DAT35_12305 [Vitiosangium sp. GDMCC 1.1324]
MSPSDFDATNPNNVTFPGQNLGTAYNLCTSQRFRDDPTAAFCSGTRIDDDLVLTAGHCVTSANDCTNTRFVFNYDQPSAGTQVAVNDDSCSNRADRRTPGPLVLVAGGPSFQQPMLDSSEGGV